MAENKNSEKKESAKRKVSDSRKTITEDVDRIIKDFWGKVVEYASMGAEEASKVSATAKARVDIETLRFKRGKVVKILGERYLGLCEKDSSLVVPGTKEIISQIKKIDREVRKLEGDLAGTGKAPAKKPSVAAKKRKTPASKRKAPLPKKTEKTPRAGRSAASKKPAANRDRKKA